MNPDILHFKVHAIRDVQEIDQKIKQNHTYDHKSSNLPFLVIFHEISKDKQHIPKTTDTDLIKNFNPILFRLAKWLPIRMVDYVDDRYKLI